MTQKGRIIFGVGSDNPADLLDNVSDVVRCLSDSLCEDDTDISKEGKHGLWLILRGVEDTIKEAEDRISNRRKVTAHEKAA